MSGLVLIGSHRDQGLCCVPCVPYDQHNRKRIECLTGRQSRKTNKITAEKNEKETGLDKCNPPNTRALVNTYTYKHIHVVLPHMYTCEICNISLLKSAASACTVPHFQAIRSLHRASLSSHRTLNLSRQKAAKTSDLAGRLLKIPRESSTESSMLDVLLRERNMLSSQPDRQPMLPPPTKQTFVRSSVGQGSPHDLHSPLGGIAPMSPI